MNRRTALTVLGASLVALTIGATAAPAVAVPLFPFVTVANTNDSGAGSLRDAIDRVNDPSLTKDVILFNIPGGGRQVITPVTDLPALTAPVTIDGYSQPGATQATANANAVLNVVIDAAALSRGLEVLTDDSLITGLVIRDASVGVGTGVRIEGDRNVVAGNYIGVTANGEQAAGNSGYGVDVRGEDNVVGGSTVGDRNVISANALHGVMLVGDGNIVSGNRVGTDDDGTTDLGNGQSGVEIVGGSNLVGGLTVAAGNLISGNGSDGVSIDSTGTGNTVLGNRIGTDTAGTAPLSNDGDGVFTESTDTMVSDNVIAANLDDGIRIEADIAVVLDNRIGTNATGTAALPNGRRGIYVDGSDNVIGARGKGNVISGNDSHGIWIGQGFPDPNAGNIVQGNFIGTDINGGGALGNVDDGIQLDASDSQIGGRRSGEGNVVSANGGSGIDASAEGNRIEGNTVGTNAAVTVALPNGTTGIEVSGDDNRIGQNTVAFNTEDGIEITSGLGNAIVSNSVFGNGDLGIDLNADGVTLNDAQDLDAGPNDLLNYPVVVTASSATGIDWKVEDGLSATMLRLEFFVSPACDPSGNGESLTPLGATLARTTALGYVGGQLSPSVALVPGQAVVMTATLVLSQGPLVLGSTSEFSVCQTVS